MTEHMQPRRLAWGSPGAAPAGIVEKSVRPLVERSGTPGYTKEQTAEWVETKLGWSNNTQRWDAYAPVRLKKNQIADKASPKAARDSPKYAKRGLRPLAGSGRRQRLVEAQYPQEES